MKIEREEFEKERNYLNKTVSLIRKKISNLGQELFDDDSKVLEFKKLVGIHTLKWIQVKCAV